MEVKKIMDWSCYIPFEGKFDELEKFLENQLPEDLKHIIENYNKGCPLKSKFSFENDESDEIDRLISFNKDGESNIYDYFTDEIKEKNLIPFATTENNNILCLKDGKIVIYNFENDEQKIICSNVTELLQMLY